MGAETKIEWTGATWNPVRGCSRVSEGCRNCYAETVAARFSGPGQPYAGFADRANPKSKWTGKVALVERALTRPLRWKKPRRIFVNSMSDLFHESLPDEAIDQVFAVMALAPQHDFQVLTKRPERMRNYLAAKDRADRVWQARLAFDPDIDSLRLPLLNVWLGVSVEDQAAADARIPHLLATPAAVRFLSCEPLLGPVDLTGVDLYPYLTGSKAKHEYDPTCTFNALTGRTNVHPIHGVEDPFAQGIDWVIAGGESGPGARPMRPDWARALRDQCAAAGVPFFFKQWGEFAPRSAWPVGHEPRGAEHHFPDGLVVFRPGKGIAGRLLDGVEHSAFPEGRP